METINPIGKSFLLQGCEPGHLENFRFQTDHSAPVNIYSLCKNDITLGIRIVPHLLSLVEYFSAIIKFRENSGILQYREQKRLPDKLYELF